MKIYNLPAFESRIAALNRERTEIYRLRLDDFFRAPKTNIAAFITAVKTLKDEFYEYYESLPPKTQTLPPFMAACDQINDLMNFALYLEE